MSKLIKNKSKFWLLIGILILGIFLRTYNFHDWLRFSMDQSRDALMISKVIEGDSSWPLLGPLAGGTDFHLGPAYYYFSIISAKIFGNYPDKMAYPSLFFSILAVVLFYFFLREYFSERISIGLIAIMSFSYFTVFYSRFSSNPNLAPFFVLLFLYSFLKISQKEKNKWLWSAVLGVAVGVGIQLHSTLLIIMPIGAIFGVFYLFYRDGKGTWKPAATALAIILILNLPQILSEIKNDWSNSRSFLSGFLEKSGNKEEVDSFSFLKKTGSLIFCQAKFNAHIIASVPQEESCSKGINFDIKSGSKELYGEIKSKFWRRAFYSMNILFAAIFFVWGYFHFFKKTKNEKNEKRRMFLWTILFFNFISLIFMLPVADYLYLNYFNIIFFVPFVFLGLFLEQLENKFKRGGTIIGIFIILALSVFSLAADFKEARIFSKGLDNNLENTDLREIENISKFILKETFEKGPVYLSGEKKYLERYGRPIEYMVKKRKMDFFVFDSEKIDSRDFWGKRIFYIKNREKDSANKKDTIKNRLVLSSAGFFGADVYFLEQIKNDF